MVNKITASAPGSLGNFSVGFDLLGIALQPVDGSYLGDRVSIEASKDDQHHLSVDGPFADELPPDPEENIVWHCLQHFLQQPELTEGLSPVQLHLEKNLPVGSGLGSSASSIVAAVVAINAWLGEPLDQAQQLQLCVDLEKQISGSVHLDNVAPSLLGGAQLCIDPQQNTLLALDMPEDWFLVVAYSGQRLATKDMRQALPDEYPRSIVIKQMAALSGFVTALVQGEHDLAARQVFDLLAEPYRAPGITGFGNAKDYCLSHGALAAGISGSGPTLFALCNQRDIADHLQAWLAQNYRVNDTAFSRVCMVHQSPASSHSTE